MNSINNNQLNFANAIIHETDFHYNLPPWRACYYSDSMSTVPLQAPFDTSRTTILDKDKFGTTGGKTLELLRFPRRLCSIKSKH
ncbi:MAG: hypothetical protein IPG53_14205 [Ignavibacteriales bacterium]|nr:hypothetical protein [Ignavibacteriales bacterium]